MVTPIRRPASPAESLPELSPPPLLRAHRRRDDILFVGLNPGAHAEVSALESRASVTAILDTSSLKEPSTLPLGNDAGIQRFADSLSLPEEKRRALAELLGDAHVLARDELAALARVWAAAERGAQMPARLVLSAHSIGEAFFGEHNGTLRLDELERLAALLPNAAAQIEDLHISSCYSGFDSQLAAYRRMFPNLRTFWGYAGSAPGSASGAMVHERLWERATRGDATALSSAHIDRTRKGGNVVFWSALEGDVLSNLPIHVAREAVRAGAQILESFNAGDDEVTDPTRGPLRDFYDQLQRLLHHADLPDEEAPELRRLRDRALRLLYYSSAVAPSFANEHRALIREGYTSIGQPAPPFQHLSRREAIKQVEQFSQSLARRASVPAEASTLERLLRQGLVALDPHLVPEAWL